MVTFLGTGWLGLQPTNLGAHDSAHNNDHGTNDGDDDGVVRMLPGVKDSGWGIEIHLGLFTSSFLSLSIYCLQVFGNGVGGRAWSAERCLLSVDVILVHLTRGFVAS